MGTRAPNGSVGSTTVSSTSPAPSRPIDQAPEVLTPALAVPGRLGSQRSLIVLPPRVSRLFAAVLIVFCLLVGAYTLIILFTGPGYAPGYDFSIYRDAAVRWVHGGFFYYPEQVAGPYEVLDGHVLYPPVALLLFVPFTILPAVLWWVVPLSIIAWRLMALRPSIWGWVAVLVLVCRPYDVQIVFAGTPTIWIVAILALAIRWPWVSALVLVKPTLLPFALVGIRTRGWWLALAVFGALCFLFASMWPDWISVVLNARGPFSGLLYSLKDVPLMFVPVVAWVARRRTAGKSGSDGAHRNARPVPLM
jgi:hypothetical protein